MRTGHYWKQWDKGTLSLLCILILMKMSFSFCKFLVLDSDYFCMVKLWAIIILYFAYWPLIFLQCPFNTSSRISPLRTTDVLVQIMGVEAVLHGPGHFSGPLAFTHRKVVAQLVVTIKSVSRYFQISPGVTNTPSWESLYQYIRQY